MYRFGSNGIRFIHNFLKNRLEKQIKQVHTVDSLGQVLLALRYFASGSFMQNIEDTFGRDKATVSSTVTAVTTGCPTWSEFMLCSQRHPNLAHCYRNLLPKLRLHTVGDVRVLHFVFNCAISLKKGLFRFWFKIALSYSSFSFSIISNTELWLLNSAILFVLKEELKLCSESP